MTALCVWVISPLVLSPSRSVLFSPAVLLSDQGVSARLCGEGPGLGSEVSTLTSPRREAYSHAAVWGGAGFAAVLALRHGRRPLVWSRHWGAAGGGALSWGSQQRDNRAC